MKNNGEICMIDDSKYQKKDIEELDQKAYETCAWEVTTETEDGNV